MPNTTNFSKCHPTQLSPASATSNPTGLAACKPKTRFHVRLQTHLSRWPERWTLPLGKLEDKNWDQPTQQRVYHHDSTSNFNGRSAACHKRQTPKDDKGPNDLAHRDLAHHDLAQNVHVTRVTTVSIWVAQVCFDWDCQPRPQSSCQEGCPRPRHVQRPCPVM